MYLIETMGPGAAFLDYDNDGDQDIYVVNSAPLPGLGFDLKPRDALYRNNGDGSFTEVTEEAGLEDTGYGMGVAVADYDNDGHLDIYLTNYGRNLLYHNNGDGTFTDVTQKAGVGDDRWGTSAAFADVDGDGNLDLYVTNFLDMSLEKNVHCFDPKSGDRIYCGPLHFNGVPDILYRNNGNGTFTDFSEKAGIQNPEGKGLGVVFLDFDNDGDVDIYIANDSVRNFLYKNNGKGYFTDVTYLSGTGFNMDGRAQAGMGTDAGDYDNDGHFDLIVTNFFNDFNTLYHNNGNGIFEDLSFSTGVGKPSFTYVGWGTSFFDYDNDGDQDLFIVNGHPLYSIKESIEGESSEQVDLLLENQRDGIFSDISQKSGDYFQKAHIGRGLATGDYDNDGDVDLFVTNNNQNPILLRNDGGNQSSWLLVKVVGTRSNRDGIGTRITVVTGNLIQMDEVRSGSSYLCQNDFRVHFGLGNREKVDRMEVRWPSGQVEQYRDLKVNQLLIITEGEGIREEKLEG
jgi:hypothetical protein